MDKNRFGFLSFYETETPDSYVGTVLITDEFGIPIEFKCTHAVKPTTIQKALYGNQLKPYIAVELCSVPLLKSVLNNPEAFIVNIPYLLSVRMNIDTPTVLIKRVGETINIQTDDNKNSDGVKEKIENDNTSFQPIIIQSHSSFIDDVKTVRENVSLIFKNFDLMEPFERMKKSVDILGKHDSKFK